MAGTDTPTIELPEILSNEDGDVLLAQGHVDPLPFMISVVVYIHEHCPEDFDQMLLGGPVCYAEPKIHTHGDQARHLTGLLDEVRHVTFRPDPNDEENMLPCEPDHPESQAWTQIKL